MRSWLSMHMPQPFIAETARLNSSKSSFSMPGAPIVHPEARRQRLIFRVRDEVDEAVIDIVHRHHRRCSTRGVRGWLAELAFGLGLGGGNDRAVARSVGAGEEEAVFALIAERLVGEQGRDVEPKILRIIGKDVGELVQGHDVLRCSRKRGAETESLRAPLEVLLRGRLPGVQAAGRSTSWPSVQLHGQSSSVCSASRTRNVSCGFRPTLRPFTVTCWMILSGSTMKVAR